MDGSMSHYPPPDQSYPNAYPVATGPPQSTSPSAIDQLQLSAALNDQAQYGGPIDGASGYSGVEASIAELNSRDNRDNVPANGGLPDQSPQQQAAPGASAPPADGVSPRTNRLRKACDSCSIRKVKCDEQGPPCRACSNLDIPCTFERPSRRRGPPNRHAESIKRRRLEGEDQVPGAGGHISPASPTQAATALAALSSVSSPPLSAENISSLDVVERLVADFFTYVHPLAPFPHETTFMQAFRRRDDVHNRYFVALIASMVAALVAAFPKRARMQLRALGHHEYREHRQLVDHCLRTCTQARGPAYLDRDELNIYDAITSYFIAQAHACCNRPSPSRRYLAEALTIIRSLNLPSLDLQLQQQHGFDSDGKPQLQIDFITQELARRIFWKAFIDLKTMQQLGENCAEVAYQFPSSSRMETPLPLERDDVHIFNNSFESQAYATMSELTGFTQIVRVYQATLPLADLDPAFSSDTKHDLQTRRAVIKSCLDACKLVPTLPDTPTNPYRELQDFLNGNARGQLADDPMEQRNQQIAMQKADLDASAIATRFYLVDLFWKAGSSDADNDQQLEQEMREERSGICKDLLHLVGRAGSLQVEFVMDRFVRKLDHVAYALLQHVPERIGTVSGEDSQLLSQFHAWAGNSTRIAQRDDAWLPEEVERALMTEWNQVQNAVNSVYRGAAEGLA